MTYDNISDAFTGTLQLVVSLIFVTIEAPHVARTSSS